MTDSLLTKLDKQAVAAEDSADEVRWRQAAEVVKRLDAGETTREVAASWINARTGNPYGMSHVVHCAEMHKRFASESELPEWAPAYAAVSHKTTRPESAQAQVPTTPEIARKFVENLHKAPQEVVDILRTALPPAEPVRAEAGAHKLREEKEAEAATARTTGPLRRSLGVAELRESLGVSLELARGLDGVSDEQETQIDADLEAIRTEVAIKRSVGELTA
ncbi:MAG TPA: hypothetical protein VIJ16_11045 [Gemmatimonadaceae bacterium]